MTTNVYTLIFESSGVDADALMEFMRGEPAIVDYHTSVPANVFVGVSPLEAKELSAKFAGVGGLDYYLFTRIALNRYGTEISGMMPVGMWQFILRYADPERRPSEPLTTPITGTSTASADAMPR